jgi:hypothetical protein
MDSFNAASWAAARLEAFAGAAWWTPWPPGSNWVGSNPTGALSKGTRFALAPPVVLTQGDIRELQLAKGAIAAGLRILVQQWGADLGDQLNLFEE